MKNFLNSTMCLLAAVFFFNLVTDAHAADEFPSKPIIYIIAIEAGGDADVLCRPLAQKASSILGKPIIIVNKPGAGGSIGYREIHDARPDGYTIGWGGLPLITNKLHGILPYDYHAFTQLATHYLFYNGVFGSAKTQRPFASLAEAISFAKSHPGELKMGCGAPGQITWLGAMALQAVAGVKFNIIPQPGTSGFIAAQLGGGHVDLGIGAVPSMKPQVDAGNVRFLAVLGPEPSPQYKNVPTMKDLKYDLTISSVGLVIGPPKMPKDIADKLSKAFAQAATDPQYQNFILDRFATPFSLPPDKIIPYLDKQEEFVRGTMQKAGLLKGK